jgi:hypothetical protein
VFITVSLSEPGVCVVFLALRQTAAFDPVNEDLDLRAFERQKLPFIESSPPRASDRIL